MTRIITRLNEISHRYRALFVDLWGCVHNGLHPFPAAVAALRAYRAAGGRVVLVTNSPKPRKPVEVQLARIGVPRACWDALATSGDSARAAMYRGIVGRKIYLIGDEIGDAGFFRPLRLIDKPVEIQKVPLQAAEGIVCTGPFDPHADPSVNRPDFLYAVNRGLRLLCANPDIVVDLGERRQWCAGALARLYSDMGGESLYFGKPHPPIYDLARRRLAALGADIPDSEILAIGDGIGTDIRGAAGEGIESLFLSGGLAARETGTRHRPDPGLLTAYLERENATPTYTAGFLE